MDNSAFFYHSALLCCLENPFREYIYIYIFLPELTPLARINEFVEL